MCAGGGVGMEWVEGGGADRQTDKQRMQCVLLLGGLWKDDSKEIVTSLSVYGWEKIQNEQ